MQTPTWTEMARTKPVTWRIPPNHWVREGTDDAIIASLRDRLATIERAEQRLAAGTYGLSIQSGVPIPDERLEADPAAELTVDEALALDQ